MSLEQQDNIKFAQFIQKYPCLYDYSCKAYTSRTETDNAWKEISTEFNISVKDCKFRWKNIRTVFRRHLFGVSTTGLTPKRDYYLSNALQFMIPIMRGAKRHQDQDFSYEENDYDASSLLEMELDARDVIPQDLPPPPELKPAPEIFHEKANSSNASDIQFQPVRKRKSRDTPTEAEKQYFRPPKVERRQYVVNQDQVAKSDELFLLSLKEDMRQMNVRQKRLFKRRIYEAIDEIMMDPSVESDDQPEAGYDYSRIKVEGELLID